MSTDYTTPRMGAQVITPDGPGIFDGVTGHLYAARFPNGVPAVGLAPGSVMGYSPSVVTPLDEAVSSAWAALLWSTPTVDDTGPEFLDGIEDATPGPGIMERLSEYIAAFLNEAVTDVTASGLTLCQVGHDLILTANGHGTGFWDRGLAEYGDRLTAAAHKLGPVDAYQGDDALIYVMGWGA